MGRAVVAISPDGSDVADVAGDLERGQIYRRRLGSLAPNGRELFFVNRDSMAVVPIESESPFVHGEPRVLFKFRGSYALDSPRNFDISPDGRRFLMIKEAPEAVAALDPKARSELVLVFLVPERASSPTSFPSLA